MLMLNFKHSSFSNFFCAAFLAQEATSKISARSAPETGRILRRRREKRRRAGVGDGEDVALAVRSRVEWKVWDSII